MSEIRDASSMWDREEPKTRGRWLILLGLLVVMAGCYAGLRELFSPRWAWRRAIHGPNAQARADLWSRLQRETLIDGLDRSSTIDEVFASLDDPDPEVRGWAVSTVPSIKVDPVVPAAGKLGDAEVAARSKATIVAIARIAGKLGDAEVAVREKAAAALGEVVRRGEPGRDEAIEALARALKDPRGEVRKAAVIAIGQVVYAGGHADDPLRSGRPDDPALGLVAGRLRDDDRSVQVEAACVLAFNDSGDEALPMLKSLIREQPLPAPLGYLADRAFLALMALAVHSQEAAAFLCSEIAVHRDGYPDRPRDALAWVARQGPEGRSVARRVANEALRSKDLSLRHNAAILLHEIGYGKLIIPELVAALGDPSVDIRSRAVEALADLGDIDPAIVPALQAATSDPNREVREHAYSALEAIEWDAMESDEMTM